jgi:cytochrome bd ubiquinol oxidase subunit II
METLWFILVALTITAYVILDGFDLGAGILHLAIARTDEERRTVIRTIGPVWDGNEVFLIAGGGTLFFAFPALYASSFSGFYLPLCIVLWLLIGRAIGIEFRHHLDSKVWTDFFDGCFCISSALLAIFFGAALGNVVRGVAIDKNGVFFAPLWTSWRPDADPGILDWYSVIAGLVALIALAVHGALFIAVKTEGQLNQRARRFVRFLWPLLIVITVLSLLGTVHVRPEVLDNFRAHPAGLLIPFLVIGGLTGMLAFSRKGDDRKAFASSCLYLAAMLVGAAFGLYPNVLPARNDPANSLTIYNTASGSHGLTYGLVWWGIGMALAVTYFVIVYRMFRGKVTADASGYGH